MTDTIVAPEVDNLRTLSREESRAKALAAAEHLLSVEGIVEWVTTRRSYKYSFGNQILIAMQAPGAAYVASRTDWKKYGREVIDRTDYVGIWNKPFMGTSDKHRDDKGNPKSVRIFTMSGIFAIENTSVVNEALWAKHEQKLFQKLRRTRLPEDAIQPLTGDSHKKAIAALKKLAADNGWSVKMAKSGSEDGTCSFGTKTVTVNTDRSVNQQVLAFIHELVHALGETTYNKLGRARAEVITEVTAYVVCQTIGLETKANSIGYIASFLDQVRQQSSDTVKAMKNSCKAIDNVAKMIEDAIIPALGIEVEKDNA